MTLTKSTQQRLRPSGRRRRAGFSILEMLVVVVLVGIIMSVAGGRVSGMMSHQRVVRAASTVQNSMELAYAVAGRNRTPTRISWTSSSGALLLRVTDRAGAVEYNRVDMKPMGLSDGEVIASSAAVDVFPNGFASDTLSITITVTKSGVTYKRRVRMSRAGLVKVL